jgi:hypothetical protein
MIRPAGEKIAGFERGKSEVFSQWKTDRACSKTELQKGK